MAAPPPSEQRMAELLRPYVAVAWSLPLSLADPEQVLARIVPPLSLYLELLLRWNAKTNLTSVREPEEVVTRHIGESLFASLRLPAVVEPGATVLDYGAGAGFPGIPLQILLPVLSVTLAESQGKKASFLREAVRVLGMDTEVWPRRVEELPTARRFHVVALRAVDQMDAAMRAAHQRVSPDGYLLVLADRSRAGEGAIRIPDTESRWVGLVRAAAADATCVPRET